MTTKTWQDPSGFYHYESCDSSGVGKTLMDAMKNWADVVRKNLGIDSPIILSPSQLLSTSNKIGIDDEGLW